MSKLLEAVNAVGEFKTYHEPFLGGGALFFELVRNGLLRHGAHLSDNNTDLMSAYTSLRDDLEGVLTALREHEKQHSEKYFYAVRATKLRAPAKKAARVIYLNRTCFNGLYRENSKGQFNTPFGHYQNPRIVNEENLRAVATTLSTVKLHTRSFLEAADDVRPGDLAYFDPPYIPLSPTASFTSYSKSKFSLAQQELLAQMFTDLANRGAKVIASNALTELTCELYGQHFIYTVAAIRRVNSRGDRRGPIDEALITNFPVSTLGTPHQPTSRAPIQPKLNRQSAKQWLTDNGYPDIVKLINEVSDELRASGRNLHHDWWQILAGTENGRPRSVAKRMFPVLRAAQIYQGLPVTENALRREMET